MSNPIQNLVSGIQDRISGKVPSGAKRSPEWSRVREQHLKDQPTCQVCGSTKKLQVHHKRPFHLHPDLELEPSNLITLCENAGSNCHLVFGHLGNFKSFNISVETDAKAWSKKVKFRPLVDTKD